MQEEKYNAEKQIEKLTRFQLKLGKRNTFENEYCVTGFYVREYVRGIDNAISRARFIAISTKRWGKVELILAKKGKRRIIQKFICVWDGEGLDVDFTEI